MTSFLSAGSTLLQGLIVLFGGVVMLVYAFNILRQTFLEWTPPENLSDLVNRTAYLFFHLGIVGLYALFAYFVTAEEMSDPGFRALEQILGGGI